MFAKQGPTFTQKQTHTWIFIHEIHSMSQRFPIYYLYFTVVGKIQLLGYRTFFHCLVTARRAQQFWDPYVSKQGAQKQLLHLFVSPAHPPDKLQYNS